MERPRLSVIRVLAAGLCAFVVLPSAVGFLCGRNLQQAIPLRDVSRAAVKKSAAAKEYKTNEEIRCTEVRLIGEQSEESNDVEECNEIMATSDAMRRADSRGLDLVMINEDRDPPLVKIVDLGKYVYAEKKRAKETARNSKVPKVKEVKLSYTIGEHDLNTKLNQMEGWLKTPRQQVKVIVQMKGRSKMFEKQARGLLTRVQEEVATFGKAAGGAKEGNVKKDGRGDLVMMMNAGPDVALLKELAKRQDELEDESDDEDDEEQGGSSKKKGKKAESQEIQDLLDEIEETKQDLLDCGISPGAISQQPEMRDLMKELDEARAKVASGAFGRLAASGPSTTSALACGALALAAGVLSVTGRGRRQLRARRLSGI